MTADATAVTTTTDAVAAEWIKAWSVRSTWWSLLGGAFLMSLAAVQMAIYTTNANDNADPRDDKGVVEIGSIAVSSVGLSQFALIALAMLLVTAEYSTGAIRTTLQWVPHRGRLLLAKTAVTAAVCGAAGTLMAMLGSAVAAPVLGRWGNFTAVGWLGDILSVGCYMALISAFTLGVGMLLRSAVGTLTVVFLILVMVPEMLRVPDIVALERVAAYTPGPAGSAFLGGGSDFYPAAVGLLVLVGWVVAALAAGGTAFRRRDA